MPFKPGQSGNPKGRPRKTTALTEILKEISDEVVRVNQFIGGRKHFARKVLLGHYVWEGATRGYVEFSNGRRIEFDADKWIYLVKWLYDRIDGTPRQAVDVTSGDEPLQGGGMVIILPSNGREENCPPTGATDQISE